MKKWSVLGLILVAGLCLLLPIESVAQSGRRRPRKRTPPRTRAEKSSAEPGTAHLKAPIPAGGKIRKEKFDPKTATTWVRLHNGLTIILREKYSQPLVALTVSIDGGKQDEPAGAEGLATLVQRLLLQGTTSRPGSHASRDLRKLGAVVRARTAPDHTIFSVTVPPEKAGEAVEIQADILQHPAFERRSVQTQAELLGQEYEAEQSSLARQAFHMMLQMALPHQSWGRMPAPESVRALTRGQVMEFYHRHYQPEKAIVSIVGAVNAFTLKVAIQRAYGGWVAQDPEQQGLTAGHKKPTSSDDSDRGTSRHPGDTSHPPSDQLRYGQRVVTVDHALITIGYRLTGVEKADQAPLEVLSAVLGRGRASRLEQKLRGTHPVVWDISAGRIDAGKAAIWSFQLWVAPQRLSQAEISFFELIQRLRQQVLSPGEVQRARSLLERSYYDRRARLEVEAEELARAEAVAGSYREADQYVQRIRGVTAKQLQHVAARYLILSRVAIYEVVPSQVASEGVTGESFTKWLTAKVPGLDTPVAARQVREAPPVPLFKQGRRARSGEETEAVIFSLQPEPLRDYSILRGSRAYVQEDHSRPTVSVGLFFQGGRLSEDSTNNGITELMLRAMLRGAKSKWDLETGRELERGEQVTLSAETMALKLEQLGAEIRLVNEPDFFGFILNVLSRNQEPALKLLIDLIERPTFEKAEFAEARRQLLFDQGRPSYQLIELTWQALAANTAYGLPRLGTPSVLQSLTIDQVRAWRNRTIGRQFPLTVIVGDTDGSLLVSALIARGFHRREVQKSIRVRRPHPAGRPQERAKSDQSVSGLTVGFLVPSDQKNLRDAFDVIAQALSGPGGRFTDHLRDQGALAYKVEVTYEQRLVAGGFFTSLVLSPTNHDRAREALRREFDRLAAEPMSEEDVVLGVNAAIGARTVKFQAHPERVLAYARHVFFNQQPADVERYGERLRALTGERLHPIARQYLRWSQRGDAVFHKEETVFQPPGRRSEPLLLRFCQ